MKRQIIRSADGHIVGTIEGQVFKKAIRAKDWVRKYDAISVNAEAVYGPILEVCGLNGLIEITVKDTGTIYRSSVKNFLRHGITDDLGSGEHLFLKKECWEAVPLGQQPLKLKANE